MIRNFFMLTVFTTTVSLAAFGQHIFGREDLVRLGHRIQAEAPAKTKKIWKKTDMMLASLAPEAGTAEDSVCTFESLQWAIHLHEQHTPS